MRRKPNTKTAKKLRQRHPTTQELNDIEQSVETVTVVKVTCCMCGEFDEDEDEYMTSDEMRKDMARTLYAKGWRNLTSEKYAMEGLMCPACVTTPDGERGD